MRSTINFSLFLKKKSQKKKEITDTKIKDMRKLFRLEKENKAVKDRIVWDIGNLFSLKKAKWSH